MKENTQKKGTPYAARTPESPALKGHLDLIATGCTDCGNCTKACGFLERNGTPREIAGHYEPSSQEGHVLPFECNLCGLCDALCPIGLHPSELFLEMRREAASGGTADFPEHAGLVAYEQRGMSGRYTWYGLPEGCRAVFFPGCALPGTRPERTKQVYQTLRQSDPSVGIVLDCCGRISRDLGRESFFRAMFDEMTAYLTGNGVEKVLTACPNCYGIFKTYGKGLRVRMIYDALPDSAFPAGTRSGEILLHDPCGVRFHPEARTGVRRRLEHTGIGTAEMASAGTTSLCCGSGGGVAAFSPELADLWIRRFEDESRGRPIATYCAGCTGRLSERKIPAVHALDLLYDPVKTLEGRQSASKAPFTYLNRLRLKRWLKGAVKPAATRQRSFWAGKKPKKSWAARLALLAALFAVIVAVRMAGLAQFFDPDSLRQTIATSGALAPLVYMLIYTAAPVLLLPGLPLTIAGGILFGPFWGVVYTIIGATAGACAAFLASRYLARDWVARRIRSPRWRRLDEGVARNGWKMVALTRLIPLFPFNLLNYAFGLTKVGFWPYAAATFLFMLPACIAFIVFSSSLPELIRGTFSVNLFAGLGLIALVSALPLIYRKIWRKN